MRSIIQSTKSELTVKRQLMTLIALEECYVQDKVTNLPLFLRLFDQTERIENLSASNNLELLSAYKAFMAKAETQFAFIKQSP